MNKKKLVLDDIHRETLKVLRKIIEISDEIGIDYSIAYGTLIGAVRHKGFIPWDDDLDVIMLRDDYEKFCDYCIKNEDKIKPFRLASRKTDKDYPYTLCRLVDTTYKAVFDNTKDYICGTFIDLYPFDYIKSNDSAYLENIRKKKKRNMKFGSMASQRHPDLNQGIVKNITTLIQYCFAKVIGKNYFLNKLEKIRIDNCDGQGDYVGCLVWDMDMTIYPKEDFEKYEYLDFEDLKVKVPCGYKDILTKVYGDYMKLPPEDERVQTHGYSIYEK